MTWRQYKDEYKLSGSSLIRQLFASCSEELCHSLSRSTGGSHFNKSEKQLLELMKQLAVQYQNPAVHVQEFLRLVQQQDEGVCTLLRGCEELLLDVTLWRNVRVTQARMYHTLTL